MAVVLACVPSIAIHSVTVFDHLGWRYARVNGKTPHASKSAQLVASVVRSKLHQVAGKVIKS